MAPWHVFLHGTKIRYMETATKKEIFIFQDKEKYSARLGRILDEAWNLFRQQFLSGTVMAKTKNEALFQFCFASAIRTIGSYYVFPDEKFMVDLETRWDSSMGESGESLRKYIDITCELLDSRTDESKYSCAIELKFKPKVEETGRTAFPNNMFRIYRDMEYLERETGLHGDHGSKVYSEGRFYFITDNSKFVEAEAYEDKAEAEKDFRHKFRDSDIEYSYVPFGLKKGSNLLQHVLYHPSKGSEEYRRVDLMNTYEAAWECCSKCSRSGKDESAENWYFLELVVGRGGEEG